MGMRVCVCVGGGVMGVCVWVGGCGCVCVATVYVCKVCLVQGNNSGGRGSIWLNNGTASASSYM